MVPKTLNVKAVLFDLGNTLVYMYPEETFQKILEALGISKSLDDVKQAMIKGNQEFDIDKHSHLSAHEFYTEWSMVELRHLGITGNAKARKLAEEIDFRWFEFAKVYVYPDVKETLQRLKHKGLKLGIITGGYEEDVEKILPKAGLEKFFEVYVGVNTTGKRKPHSEAFNYALKQLRIKPMEAVFVGDQLEADYIGAKKVGMKVFLIQREGKPIAGVETIASLKEIFDFLE